MLRDRRGSFTNQKISFTGFIKFICSFSGSEDDDEYDNEFFDNIEKRINDIRSGNEFANKNIRDSVMGTKNNSRPSHNLDEKPHEMRPTV